MYFFLSIIKSVYYKLKFGKKLQIKFNNRYRKNLDIRIKNGKILNKDRFRADNNCSISSTENGNVVIGKNCFVNRNFICISKKYIEIGNNCIFGPNVCIYDHNHNFSKDGYFSGFKKGDVVIGDHVWVGANVVILPNTHIGANSIISAGTVVKGNIPNNSIVKNNRELVIKDLY